MRDSRVPGLVGSRAAAAPRDSLTARRAPYVTWDPRSYTEGNEALSALGSISHPHLKPAADAVKRGVEAITTYAKSFEDQVAEAAGKLEAAMQKLSQQQAPYVDEVAADAAEQ